MAINVNYKINEGNMIGGQEPQALGTVQNKIKASAAVTKGMVVEVTGNWTVGPAADGSASVCGIAFNDAEIGEEVVLDAEGFVKLSASNASIAAGDKVVSAGDGYVKKLAALTVADIAADLGAGYNQTTSSAAVNTAVNTAIASIEGALAGLNSVCGIVLAGCSANGNPYVKWSI